MHPTAFLAGYRWRSTQRLKTITSYVHEVVVRQYELTYDQSLSSGRSRLRSVRESDGTTFGRQTVFDWTPTQPDATLEHVVGGDFDRRIAWEEYGPIFPLDFNGDGVDDVAYLDEEALHLMLGDTDVHSSFDEIIQSSVSITPHDKHFRTSDWDNDGLDDILYFDEASGTPTLNILRSTGADFEHLETDIELMIDEEEAEALGFQPWRPIQSARYQRRWIGRPCRVCDKCA